ncbi:MAG TPA: transglycosylase SLT domain-containing protein, partial [Bdellovibrionota bacterium]|nr:transglycosylase SLT domain-containing protein [Bdellovibrionota bacterium]
MLLRPARSTIWLTALVALSFAMGDVAFAAKPKGRGKEKEKKERKAKIEKPEKFERVEKFDSAPIADSVLTPEEPEPIDKLQEKLYRLRKSKKAHALKKAYDALMEQRFSKAQALAQPFQGDEIYGDYGLWISESALRKEAEKAFEKKQYDQAQASAQKALYLALQIEARDPYSPLAKHVPKDAGMAELILGSVQWARKNHAEAQRFFNKGLQRLSTVGTFEEVRPELLQRYGESCARHKSDLCLSWVQRFLSLYPKNAVEMKAMARGLPEVLERARLPKPVSKLTQTYRTQEADQIAFDAAMTLYLAGEHRDAIDKFKAFFEEFPKSSFRFRARYWLAQALNKRSDEDKAKAELEQLYKDSPLTYYGLLASVDTSKVVESAIDPSKPMAAETDPFLLPTEIRRLRRAQSFIVEGAYDLASIELRDVKPRDALSSHFLMYLAMLCHEARNYNSSFQILSQLAQRGYEGMTTTFVIGMIFPTPFFDLIRKHATRNELDPILVLSLIKQESAFTPNVGSSVGAVGLMQ